LILVDMSKVGEEKTRRERPREVNVICGEVDKVQHIDVG